MKTVGRSLVVVIGLGAVSVLLSLGLSGCGAGFGLSVGNEPGWNDHWHDPWDDPGWNGPLYPYSGQWYGEYVFYRGRWHYHGYDTPYYDPWGWNW
jgi:hypothetical protein